MGALINVWLCRLKDVVHNADNLLIEDLRSKGEKFTCSTTLMDEECLVQFESSLLVCFFFAMKQLQIGLVSEFRG
ncbi:uncharacterized protein DS421_3g74550 [Arachis hypogaea]|nr:uncharacterized protein DS421_3g74550 [Arachis hypogaea]